MNLALEALTQQQQSRPADHLPAAPNAVTLSVVDVLHPAFAKISRWDDRDQIHRAIMALFPTVLPGDTSERRAASNILFRVETQKAGAARVLVQASTPMRPIEGIQSIQLGGFLGRLTAGRSVRFRLEANPVRVRARGGRSNPKSGQRMPILNHVGSDGDIVDELTPWLANKLAGALTGVQLTDQPRTAKHRAGTTPLYTVTFDGIGTINNPNLLRALVIGGVGRGKSYGCGLLSIA